MSRPLIPLTEGVRLRFVEGAPGECWPWLGEIHKASGYGYFRKQRAHALVYEMLVGPVPAGLVLDHLCRVRHCVNPAHLEPVTRAENVLRGNAPTVVTARTGICQRGHPITGTNRLVRTLRTKSGEPRESVACRTCQYASNSRAYIRQTADLKETS